MSDSGHVKKKSKTDLTKRDYFLYLSEPYSTYSIYMHSMYTQTEIGGPEGWRI